jgi:DNA-binding beta-propeller fold protein YncE
MDDDVFTTSPVDLYGSRGVFIVNEGNYLSGNSSLSYYDIELKQVINGIYALANGIPLGDVAYTMQIYNGKGYIVVNNSSCIRVVDANTLLHQATITGLPSPRHILFLDNNLALVSDLYSRGISIVNLATNQVTGTIKLGSASLPFYQHSSENLIHIGNEVFTNCWSFDNKIMIISTQTLSVIDSIEVGIQPSSMVLDANSKIWVMNDGGYQGNPIGWENPSLMRIDPATRAIELRLNFSSPNDIVGKMATNPTADTLYFICSNLYRMGITNSHLPTEPFIEKNGRTLGSISIDPQTGNIYLTDAKDYMSEGSVFVYSNKGVAIDTIEVGIIPGSFCFN